MKKRLALLIIIFQISIISIIISVNSFQSEPNNLEKIDESDNSITQQIPSGNIDENFSQDEFSDIIEKKYDEIESKKQEYIPKERIWQSSGPFKIDRDEYILGEKIFLIAEGIKYDEKGEIIINRPVNSTHVKLWNKIPFDGSIKSSFNVYFEPKLSEMIKICEKSDLVGEWIMEFSNSRYSPMYFSIINQILPGEEDSFNKAVC